jgi:hypothetical protein
MSSDGKLRPQASVEQVQRDWKERGPLWCGARGCVNMNAEFLDERYAIWNGG